MAKKDFATVNTKNVFEMTEKALAKPGEKPTASPEEQAERAATMTTRGRKGCKMARISMAFTPENHDFLRVMGACTGQGITGFTNTLIERFRKEHPELEEAARAAFEKLKSF